jgi:hypothetical protein
MHRLRDRVVEALQARPGESLCVGCIAKTLGTTHKSAHEATLKLEARPGFTRAYASCSICGKTRIVTTRRAPAPTPAATDPDGV